MVVLVSIRPFASLLSLHPLCFPSSHGLLACSTCYHLFCSFFFIYLIIHNRRILRAIDSSSSICPCSIAKRPRSSENSFGRGSSQDYQHIVQRSSRLNSSTKNSCSTTQLPWLHRVLSTDLDVGTNGRQVKCCLVDSSSTCSLD